MRPDLPQADVDAAAGVNELLGLINQNEKVPA